MKKGAYAILINLRNDSNDSTQQAWFANCNQDGAYSKINSSQRESLTNMDAKSASFCLEMKTTNFPPKKERNPTPKPSFPPHLHTPFDTIHE